MTKNLLKHTFIWIIILGSILTAVNLIGLGNMTIVTKETTYIAGWQWNYYKIDIYQYVKNLEYNVNILTFPNIMPNTPQLANWPSLNWADLSQFQTNVLEVLKTISKYLISGINWIIYMANLVWLTPIKLLLYPARILLSILGLQTLDEGFIKAMNIMSNVMIPYMPINY